MNSYKYTRIQTYISKKNNSPGNKSKTEQKIFLTVVHIYTRTLQSVVYTMYMGMNNYYDNNYHYTLLYNNIIHVRCHGTCTCILLYLQYFMQRHGMCGGSLMIALYCIIMAYMYMYVMYNVTMVHVHCTCYSTSNILCRGMACVVDLRVLATRK